MAQQGDDPGGPWWLPALKIASAYLAFGLVWTWGSDAVTVALAQELEGAVWVEGVKGSVFVALSTLLVFGLVGRYTNRLQGMRSRLTQTDRQYRALFETAHDAIMVVEGTSGRIQAANPAAEALTGFAARDLIGRHFLSLHPEDQHPAARRTFNRTLTEQPHLEGSFEFLRQDGERIPVEFSVAPLPWQGHQGVVGIFRDRRPLEEGERRYHQARAIYDNTAEGILVTDPQKRILTVNQAFTDITGYGESEVLGRTPAVLGSGLHDRAFYRDIYRSLEQSDRWEGELWNRRKNGELFPERLSIAAVRDRHGELINYVGVFSDVTEHKRGEAEREFLLHHDPLTELPNRRLFHQRLAHAIEGRRRDGRHLALLTVDIEGMGLINESLGHEAGDQILLKAAATLQARMRQADTLARIGGDNFACLLETLEDPEDAGLVAEGLLSGFGASVTVAGGEVDLQVAIGISVFPDDGEDAATLLRHAETAVARAKKRRGPGYRFYTEEMAAAANRRLSLGAALRRALERDELSLHFQPKVALASGEVVGAEALVRWQHPDWGLMAPAEFVPVAEETGLIVPIGRWVMAAACRQVAEWRSRGVAVGPVAVNVSAVQFQSSYLRREAQQALAEAGLSASDLQLEITEAAFLEDFPRAVEVLGELRELGVGLAVDDFGTGFSSLGYLKHLPVDTLKIDRSFVMGLPDNDSDAGIVRAVLAMARHLGLGVVAEGVETAEQRAFLQAEGCPTAQGYLFSAPLPAAAYATWLTTGGDGTGG